MWSLLFACLLFCSFVTAEPVEMLQSGEWGDYAFHHPEGKFRGLVFLFSPASGRGAEDQADASRLAQNGWAVATVDSGVYLSRVGRGSDKQSDCLYLPGAVEWTSQFLEHRLGVANYQPPFLAGRGQGGTLVFALLSQGHKGSFRAGLSRDFTPILPATRRLCERPVAVISGSEQVLAADVPLSAEWILEAGGRLPPIWRLSEKKPPKPIRVW